MPTKLKAETTPQWIKKEERRYGLEEYFQRLVASGEWELLPFCSAFKKRSPEGQVLALTEAIQNRIEKLRRFLNDLARHDSHLAYITLLDQINNLEALKREVLARFYSQKRVAKLE